MRSSIQGARSSSVEKVVRALELVSGRAPGLAVAASEADAAMVQQVAARSEGESPVAAARTSSFPDLTPATSPTANAVPAGPRRSGELQGLAKPSPTIVARRW